MREAAQVFLYAVAAAASPLVLVASLAIIGSGRGRVNGTVFMVAFMLGQSIAFLIAYLVGGSIAHHDSAGNVVACLELVAGVALIVVAWRQRGSGIPQARESSKTEAFVARLSRITPALTFGIGFPLGIGSKRLALTVLAAVSLARADFAPAADVTLWILFVLVATIVVWVPVTLYLIFGRRADELVLCTRTWIAAHEQRLTVISLVAIGVLFVMDGIVRLVS